jgi:hypothetical protein
MNLDQFTKNWFQIRDSKDTDSVDKIIKAFSIRTTGVNGDNEEYQKILEQLILKEIKKANDGIWNNVTEFFGYKRGVVTGQPRMESHISIPYLGWLYMTPDENALAFEENFARDMYADLLPDYIPWYYKAKGQSELDIGQKSKKEIMEDLEEMMGFLMQDIKSMGYMLTDE